MNKSAFINELKENLKSRDFIKIKVLIYELIVCEEWKKNVLPLLKGSLVGLNSYRTYIPIYHEAAVCNLLELLMFHRDTVESADQHILELIDYCYRKLLPLSAPKAPQSQPDV